MNRIQEGGNTIIDLTNTFKPPYFGQRICAVPFFVFAAEFCHTKKRIQKRGWQKPPLSLNGFQLFHKTDHFFRIRLSDFYFFQRLRHLYFILFRNLNKADTNTIFLPLPLL